MCSMISSQCDELRDWACELRKLANGPVNEGFPARANLFKSVDAMCQAADTIWELRCKLADMVDQRDEIERLKAENTELRRLVRTYRACHDHVGACRGCSELPDCEALEKMRSIGREVGIEVE